MWYNMQQIDMGREMHMDGRQDAKVRYSAAYPTGAERFCDLNHEIH